MSKQKFRVCGNGDRWAVDVEEVEAFTATEAAELWAENYVDNGNDIPSDNTWDLVVAALDGTITRHEVLVEWDPVFSASEHSDEPDPRTVAMLQGNVSAAGEGRTSNDGSAP